MKRICVLVSLMTPATRPASHAGSWYSGSKSKLKSQITKWIADADVPFQSRFAVGPHAGLVYCGHILGQTYAALDPSVTRVFIMGPSHVKYFEGFRTTKFSEYSTTLGPAAVDTTVTQLFHENGIKYLDSENDIREHGIEMHVPFLQSVAPQATIVPLVFCDLDESHEKLAVKLLGKYFDDKSTAFVVSSDFCHWGRSFDYLVYGADDSSFERITKSTKIERPISESIAALDQIAMKIAATGDADKWRDYIDLTGNTICGQRPLGVLLRLAQEYGKTLHFQWMGYDQSSKVESVYDTSVSYASGVA